MKPFYVLTMWFLRHSTELVVLKELLDSSDHFTCPNIEDPMLKMNIPNDKGFKVKKAMNINRK